MLFIIQSPNNHKDLKNSELTSKLLKFCIDQQLTLENKETYDNTEPYITIKNINSNPRFSLSKNSNSNARQLKFDEHVLAQNYKEFTSGNMIIEIFKDALRLAEQQLLTEKKQNKEDSIRSHSPVKTSNNKNNERRPYYYSCYTHSAINSRSNNTDTVPANAGMRRNTF